MLTRGTWRNNSLYLIVDYGRYTGSKFRLEVCQLTTVFNPRAVLCCIIALLLPASTMPAQNAPAGGATLSPTGQVTINTTPAKNSSALLGNETIRTGLESAADI